MRADLGREFRRQTRRGVADHQRCIAVGVGRVAKGEEREDVVDAVDELKLELQVLQLGEVVGRAEVGALDEEQVLVLGVDEFLGDPHVVAIGVVLAGEDGAKVLVELDLGEAEDRRGDHANDRDGSEPRPVKRDPRDTFQAESEGPHQTAIAPMRWKERLKARCIPPEALRERFQVTRGVRGHSAPGDASF